MDWSRVPSIDDIDLEYKMFLCRWSEVAKALRERTRPLTPRMRALLADKIDPDVKGRKGRRACPHEIDNRDRIICSAHGYHRGLIGTKGGPIHEQDARDWTCRMGFSDATLRNALGRFPDETARAEKYTLEALERLKE